MQQRPTGLGLGGGGGLLGGLNLAGTQKGNVLCSLLGYLAIHLLFSPLFSSSSPFFLLFSPLPLFSLSSPSLFLSLPSSPSLLHKGASTSLVTGIPGQQQQQQQQQNILQQAIQAQLMLNAVKAPGVFSDERDMAVMKFNLLQAYCGTGKGLASHQGQPQTVDFTTENPFCRFKVGEGSMILFMVNF